MKYLLALITLLPALAFGQGAVIIDEDGTLRVGTNLFSANRLILSNTVSMDFVSTNDAPLINSNAPALHNYATDSGGSKGWFPQPTPADVFAATFNIFTGTNWFYNEVIFTNRVFFARLDVSQAYLTNTTFINPVAFPAVSVTNDAYAAGWNGSTNVPTKDAVYDKIESIVGASGSQVAVEGAAQFAINFTATGSDISTTMSGGTNALFDIKTNTVGPNELISTAVTPGSYTSANITIDADGRITAAANGSSGSGDVTQAGNNTFTGTNVFTGPTTLTNANLLGTTTFEQLSAGTLTVTTNTILPTIGPNHFVGTDASTNLQSLDGDRGDFTLSGLTATIDNNAITGQKLANTIIDRVHLTNTPTGTLPPTWIAGADPNADRIYFWDDSAGANAYLAPQTGLSISGTSFSLDNDLARISVPAYGSGDTIIHDGTGLTNTTTSGTGPVLRASTPMLTNAIVNGGFITALATLSPSSGTTNFTLDFNAAPSQLIVATNNVHLSAFTNPGTTQGRSKWVSLQVIASGADRTFSILTNIYRTGGYSSLVITNGTMREFTIKGNVWTTGTNIVVADAWASN